MRRVLVVSLTLLLLASLGPRTVQAVTYSGQHVVPQGAIEPAYNGGTGAEIFLQIPGKATIPADAPWSPLYLPVYPPTSTLGNFDCTPANCDHVNALPASLVTSLGLQSVYPLGTVSTPYGMASGGLVKGHDHITAGSITNVVRHVYLVLFTTQGAADGAIDQELTSVSAMQAAIAAGDALAPIDTGIAIKATVGPGTAYLQGS